MYNDFLSFAFSSFKLHCDKGYFTPHNCCFFNWELLLSFGGARPGSRNNPPPGSEKCQTLLPMPHQDIAKQPRPGQEVIFIGAGGFWGEKFVEQCWHEHRPVLAGWPLNYRGRVLQTASITADIFPRTVFYSVHTRPCQFQGTKKTRLRACDRC
jgi:hypothetical protein